jgi:hypothetical protein
MYMLLKLIIVLSVFLKVTAICVGEKGETPATQSGDVSPFSLTQMAVTFVRTQKTR